ncbi:MAG: putative family peptidase [Candidatus Taylorbacteria bacterium]|nr:putative family peptidase [Candidatus Taylorbacteria bacterium]
MKKIIAYIASILLALGMYAFQPLLNTAFAATEYSLTPIQPSELPPSIKKAKSASVSILISKPVQQTRIIYGDVAADYPDSEGLHVYVPMGYENVTVTKPVGIGSGFIGTHDGRVITAKHVVDDPDAHYTVILDDGTEKPATVAYKDPDNDIAVVKIDGKYPTTATLGNSDALIPGQNVTAIGNAAQYGKSLSEGSVVGFSKSIAAAARQNEVENLSGLIETSAPMVPGFSGGPTIDADGAVIGMSIAIDAKNGLGFLIPINVIRKSIAATS